MVYVKNEAKRDTWYTYHNKFAWNESGEGGQNDSGAYNMNLMQLLHGAYNLQNLQRVDELKGLWKYIE
eukprot:1340370-Ditylum_brightwellii.AAC.1